MKKYKKRVEMKISCNFVTFFSEIIGIFLSEPANFSDFNLKRNSQLSKILRKKEKPYIGPKIKKGD